MQIEPRNFLLPFGRINRFSDSVLDFNPHVSNASLFWVVAFYSVCRCNRLASCWECRLSYAIFVSFWSSGLLNFNLHARALHHLSSLALIVRAIWVVAFYSVCKAFTDVIVSHLAGLSHAIIVGFCSGRSMQRPLDLNLKARTLHVATLHRSQVPCYEHNRVVFLRLLVDICSLPCRLWPTRGF